jgi:hypothetical protein
MIGPLLPVACWQVPEEFQDPVMNELMTDPVLLPTSGTIMDKAHVRRVLMGTGRMGLSGAQKGICPLFYDSLS